MNPKNCPDNCRFSVPVSNNHHPTLENSNVWWVFDLVNNRPVFLDGNGCKFAFFFFISLKSDFGGIQWPEVRGKKVEITRFVYILGFHCVAKNIDG
jgi:hypothetical protein